MRLLIVDDEEAVLFGMSEYFTGRGYDVDCARELEEAQALVMHREYEAVVADLRLTGTHGAEGLEVISFIRDRRPRTRVLLLTAYGTSAVTADARGRGADAVLCKPQPLGEVARVLEELIGTAA